MDHSDVSYVKRLSEALEKRDVVALRNFLKAEAEKRDPERVEEIDEVPDHDLERRMYKMILARPDLSHIHADARRWLNDQGEDTQL